MRDYYVLNRPEDQLRESALLRRWLSVERVFETLRDGTQRVVRPRPEGLTDDDVDLLREMLGREPFREPSAPDLVLRRTTDESIARAMQAAVEEIRQPEPPRPNPAEVVRERARAALVASGSGRPDPVRRFLEETAEPVYSDPFSTDD